MIKVLFLTMYSGEGDFEESQQSAKDQEGIIADFFTVKNLSMEDAHVAIYSHWNEQKDNYDMFVKLDADMVFDDKQKVIQVWNNIKDSDIGCLIVPIHDYLRWKNVPGMVFGTKHCSFNIEKVKAKAQFDTGVYVIEEGYKKLESDRLAPSGLHGHFSLPIQSFSQGVKRRIRGQWDIHREVTQLYVNNQDVLRFMFLIGWELGDNKLKNDYDYNNDLFNKCYDKAIELIEQQKDINTIITEIRKI